MQVALVVYAEEEEAANNVEMLRFLIDVLRRSQELPEEDKLLFLRRAFDRYCEQRKCAIDAFRLRPRCKFPHIDLLICAHSMFRRLAVGALPNGEL